MTLAPAGIDADPQRTHWFHAPDRPWSETNCYTDLWLQLVDRLGADPVPMLALALSTRWEGTQWTFAKPDVGDLWRLYGIRVVEMYVWRHLAEHVTETLQAGQVMTTEVDAHWLPDTAATTYHRGHEKTTIIPLSLDLDEPRMTYLHNAGCHDVAGTDLAGLLGLAGAPEGQLPPYTELVDLSQVRRGEVDVGVAREVLHAHLDRRATGNPVCALADAMTRDLPWLADAGVDTFHLYAFATARQFGAVAAMAAAVAGWFDDRDGGLSRAVQEFTSVADGMKTVQFLLARAARGRTVDLGPSLTPLADAWAVGVDELARRYGG